MENQEFFGRVHLGSFGDLMHNDSDLREVATRLSGVVNQPKGFMAEYRANTRNDLPRVGKMLGLNCDQIIDMQAVSAVLPFRVNDYVVKNLIDRENLPADPIFKLTFPQREMLDDQDFKLSLIHI